MSVAFCSQVLQSRELYNIAVDWTNLNNKIIKEKIKNKRFGPEEGIFTRKNLKDIFTVALRFADSLQNYRSGSITLEYHGLQDL